MYYYKLCKDLTLTKIFPKKFTQETPFVELFTEVQNNTAMLSCKFRNLPATTVVVDSEIKGVFSKSIFTTCTFETKFHDEGDMYSGTYLFHKLVLQQERDIISVKEHSMFTREPATGHVSFFFVGSKTRSIFKETFIKPFDSIEQSRLCSVVKELHGADMSLCYGKEEISVPFEQKLF